MRIADLPGVTLLASAVVLLVSTALLFRTLPGALPQSVSRAAAAILGRARRWRRGRRRGPDRLAITGRLPALPPGPVPAPAVPRRPTPPRQSRRPPDAPDREPDLQEAQATIERLLESDPNRLAQVIMQWVRDDEPPREGR